MQFGIALGKNSGNRNFVKNRKSLNLSFSDEIILVFLWWIINFLNNLPYS